MTIKKTVLIGHSVIPKSVPQNGTFLIVDDCYQAL